MQPKLQVVTWSIPVALKSGCESRKRLVDLFRMDVQGRSEPQNVVSGREDEQPALAAAINHLARRSIEDGADEEASPAHLDDARQRREAFDERCSPLPHVLEQLVVD